jgi:hypothetical protein
LVHGTTRVNPRTKRIRLIDLRIVDKNGKAVIGSNRYIGIALYDGRISNNKIKEAVKSWALSKLRQLGKDVQIQG